jgi:glucosamine kinase
MAGLDSLFLGVDGGGSGCRVRLVDDYGQELGSGVGGTTNIRSGLEAAWASILGATDTALAKAGLDRAAFPRIHAGLGLAGIVGAVDVERVRAAGPGFASTSVTTDAHTACIGAFAGQDGAIIIIGTGSVGYAVIRGEPHSIGGWGFEVSDQGSGADIGREAIRAALLGYDGLGPASDFTAGVIKRLGGHPPQVVSWANSARPRDYAEFARDTLGFARLGDPVAALILERAASHIGVFIRRLRALGAAKICLMGGLGPALESWLPPWAQAVLAKPQGDAVDGALLMARNTRARRQAPGAEAPGHG